VDNPAESARTLCGLGYLALRAARLAEARHCFEESLTAIQRSRQLVARLAWIPASSLEGLAVVIASQGNASRAALLLGAAHALRHRQAYGNRLGQEQPYWQRTRQMVKEALGADTFAATFALGERLTPQQAASVQTVDQLVSLAPCQNDDTLSGRLPFGQHLTRRELDVLRLLAQGLSNAQIAEKLTLSVVTVNSYLRSVYSKLDVSSRTAAIRYVWDNHLL
jgi:ATP/maltotriose-dependent transcriptional regulator MalT